MHIWNRYPTRTGYGYNKMIGNTLSLPTLPILPQKSQQPVVPLQSQAAAPRRTLPETTLYVPLQFFCRNSGSPLLLPFNTTKSRLTSKPSIRRTSSLLTESSQAPSRKTAVPTANLVAASLYVDYVFLDTDERRRMAQNPHEYLIEQLVHW